MNIARFESLLAKKKTLVMGVLNVTPDSFSDGGTFFDAGSALKQGVEMLSAGADIIDIGGQSTRPPGNTYGEGASEVSLDEELRRVLPVIGSLVAEYPDAIISIDTTKALVARRALESGASIINDVSGATEDELILDVAKEKNAPIVLMHGYGPEFTKAKIEDYHYDDVVSDVFYWLQHRITLVKEKGIKTILADVGFGFAKNVEYNIAILREHKKFIELGVPMVLGVSRKSTIGKMLGGASPSERVNGSIAAAIYGAQNGAKIIRAHDVRQTVDALKIIDRLMS